MVNSWQVNAKMKDLLAKMSLVFIWSDKKAGFTGATK